MKKERNTAFTLNELQNQLDLQASKLVVDLAAKSELGETELHKTITAKNWFHVLLIWGEDLQATEPAAGKRSRLIAAFLSPPEKELWQHEGERLVEYVWRSSAVQLHSDLAMTNSGGVSAHVNFGALELQVHRMAAGQSTNIKISMRQRLVGIRGLGTRTEELNETNGTV